jgi:hypothetical protein
LASKPFRNSTLAPTVIVSQAQRHIFCRKLAIRTVQLPGNLRAGQINQAFRFKFIRQMQIAPAPQALGVQCRQLGAGQIESGQG